MESSGSHRSGLLTAGGVLSIVAGTFQITCGGVLIVDFLVRWQHCWMLVDALFLPFIPYTWQHDILWGGSITEVFVGIPDEWAIIGGWLAILGILAVIGGISATRRRSYSLSLVGAISAIPSTILGILAIIFVAVGKREFGVSEVY